MIPELVQRRDRAWDKVDSLLDEHPNTASRGAAYRSEMQVLVAELEAVYQAATTSGGDRIEVARTARAGAVSDLASEQDRELFRRACRLFEEASSMLGDLDDVERAKLEFNYANTIRRIDAESVPLLEEAKRRYQEALAIFTTKAPQYVPQVKQALALLGSMLPLARLHAKTAAQLEASHSLQEFLAAGGDVDAAKEQFKAIKGSDRESFEQLRSLVAAAQPAQAGRDTPESARVVRELEKLIDLSKGSGDEEEARILEALVDRLGSETHADQPRLRNMGKALVDFLHKRASQNDLPGQMSTAVELRAMLAGFQQNLRYPSYGLPLPPEGTRARELIESFWNVRGRLLEDMTEAHKPRGDSRRLTELIVRSSDIDRGFYEADRDDARLGRFEAEQLRPFLLDVRAFARRRRALLARPSWGAPHRPSSNAVFVSGRAQVASQVEAACRQLGLDLAKDSFAADYAEDRWRQISSASICVFDFGSAKGPELAQIAYEAGIASTLGRTVIALSAEQLPFDIDAVPVMLESGDKGIARIRNALDRAIVWLPAPSSTDSTGLLVSDVKKELGSSSDLRIALRELDVFQDEPDPYDAITKVQQVLSMARDRSLSVIHPAWEPRGTYSRQRTLFHVMPFREGWSDRVRDEARSICTPLDFAYLRGDEGKSREIIDAIWKDLCASTILLVDLTANNANVAFELGIADTLGRPSCLVVQEGTTFMRSLAKQRVSFYQPGDRSLATPIEEALRRMELSA